MKKIALILSLLLLISSPSYGKLILPKGGVGKLKVIHLPVSIIRDNKTIKVSSFGTVVKQGDLIKTGKKGRVQLVLASGDEVFMGPATEMTVTQEFTKSSESKLTNYALKVFGKIRAVVQKTRGKRVQVKTPNATIGVKGTDFIVEYNDGATTVGTIHGLVELTSAKTYQSIYIPKGKMSKVPIGGAVLPLSEIAGTLLSGVEIAGEKMDAEDISGKKMKM